MSMTQASSKYFQAIAGQWDQIRSGYFGEAVRDTAIAKAYLRPEMTAADIGAGTGFMAAGLAPLVQKVHAVDGSAAMLDVAKKNLGDFNNIEYHEADGAHLPFADASLDAVFANMYLHHTSDPLAAIQEMVRVLRPGGRLVITDMDEHPYAWLKDEMADVWQGFDRGQMYAWFQDAGLVNVIVTCTGQSCCAESANPNLPEDGQREATISVFAAVGTQRTAMRDVVQERYAAAAQAEGCNCSSISSSSSGCCSETPQGETCCGGSSGASSCCGSEQNRDSVTFSSGYTPSELSAAPKEAAEFSLGCGNPLALAGLKPGEVVLDIGSGGGLDAFLAAARVGPAGQVIGVDMTPEMLERAHAAAERNHLTQVEFREGYAEKLPVADEEVDVVISNCVINLVEDKGLVFQEAFRVLKPGGRLEVSDMVTSGAMPAEMRENGADWAACVSGALPEQEYLDLIAQAGFRNITTRRSTSMGGAGGVSVYSVIASAQKPDPAVMEKRSACCG